MQNVDLVSHADVSIPAFRIAGVSVRTHNDEAMRTIPALWARAMAIDFTRLPRKAGLFGKDEIPLIALYSEYESDHTGAYTLTVGVPIGEGAIDRELEAREVRAGLRSHLEAKGPKPQALWNAWQHVWNELTPRRTFADDLEVYWPSRGEGGAVDLYISVR